MPFFATPLNRTTGREQAAHFLLANIGSSQSAEGYGVCGCVAQTGGNQ
jgi:hypothetical protein